MKGGRFPIVLLLQLPMGNAINNQWFTSILQLQLHGQSNQEPEVLLLQLSWSSRTSTPSLAAVATAFGEVDHQP